MKYIFIFLLGSGIIAFKTDCFERNKTKFKIENDILDLIVDPVIKLNAIDTEIDFWQNKYSNANNQIVYKYKLFHVENLVSDTLNERYLICKKIKQNFKSKMFY